MIPTEHTELRPAIQRVRTLPCYRSFYTTVALATVGQATGVGQEKSPLHLRRCNGLGQLLCTARGVLDDVEQCNMATGTRKREEGQLAQKSLRGAMDRRRRQPARLDPLPPCRRFSSVKMHSNRVKPTLYDMCCKLLWPTYSDAIACRGRPNVACRDRRFTGR